MKHLSTKVELFTECHCKAHTSQALLAAFCIQAALYIPGWNKDHTAAKMLLKLKEQICVWLYFAFLALATVITTDPTLKDQCEKASCKMFV